MNRTRTGRVALGGLTAALVLSGCINASVTENDIYRPQKGGALTADMLSRTAPDYTVEPQTVTTADGASLNGVLLRRPGATRTVLFFGGNGFTVEKGGTVARELAPLNVNLMMLDHRGYGTSTGGEPTVAALMSDAVSIFDHTAALPGVSPSSVVVHGHSFGSFMAGHVAAVRPTAGVVLEGSATNADDFVRAQIPFYARPLVRVSIGESLRGQGNLQNMTRFEEPMLVIVGAKDDVTPPSLSRALFKASTLPASKKRLAVVAGADHRNALQQRAGIDAYAEFLTLTR